MEFYSLIRTFFLCLFSFILLDNLRGHFKLISEINQIQNIKKTAISLQLKVNKCMQSCLTTSTLICGDNCKKLKDKICRLTNVILTPERLKKKLCRNSQCKIPNIDKTLENCWNPNTEPVFLENDQILRKYRNNFVKKPEELSHVEKYKSFFNYKTCKTEHLKLIETCVRIFITSKSSNTLFFSQIIKKSGEKSMLESFRFLICLLENAHLFLNLSSQTELKLIFSKSFQSLQYLQNHLIKFIVHNKKLLASLTYNKNQQTSSSFEIYKVYFYSFNLLAHEILQNIQTENIQAHLETFALADYKINRNIHFHVLNINKNCNQIETKMEKLIFDFSETLYSCKWISFYEKLTFNETKDLCRIIYEGFIMVFANIFKNNDKKYFNVFFYTFDPKKILEIENKTFVDHEYEYLLSLSNGSKMPYLQNFSFFILFDIKCLPDRSVEPYFTFFVGFE